MEVRNWRRLRNKEDKNKWKKAFKDVLRSNARKKRILSKILREMLNNQNNPSNKKKITIIVVPTTTTITTIATALMPLTTTTTMTTMTMMMIRRRRTVNYSRLIAQCASIT